ncbi:GlxA family transcriptional regulator [Aquisalimonas lutea]|uniref:GlxA family transcriptional regulator n=1 Tax=Aquisalimonas lutea TaxID=1327750 RepID=UPI0025B3FFF9|nr:GlxA family transcriptional regulator [Aquisalimonas lutea]MDN3519868.1 GlxA family transcriptional regulator [Aquisalimonas lutea]
MTGSYDPPRDTDCQAPADGAALSVAFILLPGFTLLPFAAFVDCLRLAADEGDSSRQLRCRWTILGDTRRPVESSCGVTITPWEPLQDPGKYDYVVVVGGRLANQPVATPEVIDYLRLADRRGTAIVGLCTAAFTLIQAGLMDGHRCCVSWYHYYDLLERYPDITPVADQLFVVDRKRITCAGGSAAADVAAWLVEKHCGQDWAQKSLHIMLIDQPRRATASQPQPPLHESIRDNRVRRAVLLIEQHLSNPMTVQEMAEHLNVSRRQLERAFVHELGLGPSEFCRRLRLRYGWWLLSHTSRSITVIASECGFTDSPHFSRQFRQMFGQSPSAVRMTMQRDRPEENNEKSTEVDNQIFQKASSWM